ncbi:hypothetical protein H4S00_001286 [Coemansia sp. D1744]|nr:hypothetical protein H4S00_001286 [Coemansia sp. D1744]
MEEEPYIVQTLVQGLALDESSRGKSVEWPKPRRQSLSQRLGFQATERIQSDNDDTASQASEGADSVDRSSSPALRARAIRVECVEMCGTNVYVGTSHGHIVHYTINVPELTSDKEPERVCVQSVDLKLGGKRVEQLIALPMLNRLVVLCGSTLVFYMLSDLRVVSSNSAPTIKGVSCVACDERVDRTSNGVLLCVARMREISVYFVGADVRLEQQVMIEYSVASLCMYGNYVCLADTQTYKVLDLARIRSSGLDQGQLELLPTQQPRRDESGRVVRPPRPRTLVVGPNEFMFLTASGDDTTLGVIVTARGEALRGTLQFPAYPVSIVYDEPHVIAVFATGRIDVYDTRSEPRVVQSVVGDVPDLMRVRRACVCAGGWVSTRVGRREAIDASDLRVFEPSRLHEAVSGRDRAVWTEAVDEEVEWRRELVDEAEPPVWPGPDRQNGLDRKTASLSRWTDANIVVLGSDSLHILAPQPQLIHIDALLHQQHVKEAVALVDAALKGTTISMQSDEVEYCMQVAGMVCLKNMQLDDALLYFQRGHMDPRALLYLYPSHAEYAGPLLVPFAHIAMAPTLRQLFYEIGDLQSIASPEQQSQTEDLLEQYLEFCRTQMNTNEPPYASDAVPVIDTVLARVYADNMRHAKFSALVQCPNSVVGDIACAYLESAHKYYSCSLVYMAQGDVRSGLDLWRRLLEGEVSDERFGGMAEYLEYILGDLGDGVGHGLVDEYYWLVRHDVEASRHILACLADDTVAVLDADRVVGDMQAVGAQREFIERLIAANHTRAPHFTTILLTAYVAEAAQSTDAESGFQSAQARDLGLTFQSYVASEHSSRARLVEMLGAQRSVFDAPKVLACIEDAGNLGVERAMVLARLGRRDEAVEALVKAGDYAEAEMLLLRPMARESLARLAKQDASDKATDVARLLHLYVSVVDDDMAARLVSRLLDTYSEHISASTIEELPEHWMLGVVEPFVRHKLSDLAQSERASSVQRSVAIAHEQNARMQCAGDLINHGPVVLGVAQTCGVCRKLLGSSAFVYEPQSKQVKHISCA